METLITANVSFVPNHANNIILKSVLIIWLVLDVFISFLFLSIESILLDNVNVSTCAISYLYSDYQNIHKKFLLGDDNKYGGSLTLSCFKDDI